MSIVRRNNRRVFHLPSASFNTDGNGPIQASAVDDLAATAPLIPSDQFMLVANRLLRGAKKRHCRPRNADEIEA